MLVMLDSTPHGFEPLESISNEWQRHVSRVFITQSLDLLAVSGRCILLGNLVNREVADIDVGRELGLEWSANGSKVVPLDAVEKGVRFDFLGAVLARLPAKAVARIAEHTTDKIVSKCLSYGSLGG